MKPFIIPAIRLTVVLTILLCIIYPIAITFAGKLANGKEDGETVTLNGKVVGYSNVGQKFDRPQYFWGRPSAVAYNAAGSAGSNKGPSNPDYLKNVQNRIDTLLKYHPYLKKGDIPADMVTASGSGLDPDISPAGAQIQIDRIAKVRGLNRNRVAKLVSEHIDKPLLGLLGPGKVNVLELNIALNQLGK